MLTQMLSSLPLPWYLVSTRRHSSRLPWTYSQRGDSGRNQTKMTMMPEKRSCSHTGMTQAWSAELSSEPRTAPAARMEPVNQKVLYRAVTTGRVS